MYGGKTVFPDRFWAIYMLTIWSVI
jgi:hypothetical protein